MILDKDPTAVGPETLDTLKVIETITEGKTTFAFDTTDQKRAEMILRPTGD